MISPARFSAILLLSVVSASAQIPSHTPTVKPAPGGIATQTVTLATPTGKPVARVNSAVLTDHDLFRQMLVVFPYAKQHGGRIPKDSEPQIRSNALRDIEFEELVYQEALRRKMTIAPARLDKAMADFKKQFAPKEFQTYLKAELRTEANLRTKVRRAILVDDLLKAEIVAKSRVTEPELRQIYSKNPERFRKPESISLQTISIVSSETSTPAEKAAARKRAEEALRQAKLTKDYESFGVLAEKVSEDDWRVMMGDHKWLHRGRMPAEVEKAAFALKPGQISDLIVASDSFVIVRVNERQDAKLVPFADIREKLKKDVESQKADALRVALDARLRKTAKVEELN